MPRDFVNFPETEPDVFSVRGLIRWLETQPPETEYDYVDIRGCLLFRYIEAIGFDVHSAGGWDVVLRPTFVRREVIPISSDIACALPWTYGAALERARKLEADHAV